MERKSAGSLVTLDRLSFVYDASDAGAAPLFRGLSAEFEAGSRTLLVGANGAGKSTLLRLIAGQHLLPRQMLTVFGRSPFHDPPSAGAISLVDGDFPVDIDIRVEELLAYPSPGVDARLQTELSQLLEVDPRWRMHRVSEGQRRRVQLLLALRKPVDLLLLDEITAHLDLVVRSDLIAWLAARSASHGMSVIYATHIFDGLGQWPTHLCFVGLRDSGFLKPVGAVPELASRSLLSVCESWIRKDTGR